VAGAGSPRRREACGGATFVVNGEAYHARVRRRARPTLTLALAAALCAAGLPAQDTRADLCVVTYNIRHGRGADGIVDLDRTAGVLRPFAPDIVGLQEVDDLVERSGRVPEAARLGEALGMNHAFGRFMDYQGGAYGLAILSRHPILQTRSIRLPDGNEPRVAVSVDVRLPDGRTIAVVNVHFDWVRDDGFRFAQAETLARHLDGLATPYVLLGDFNDVPGSRTLALFASRAEMARKPEDNRFTFPAPQPEREIDFIFHSPRTAFTAREVRVIDERAASDHRPVLAVLAVR
jgi:endonuclease/exonuclease/phosphatase family metal-dependent hydrolase